MVARKKVVKVKVQVELEDGMVSHLELPADAVLFIDPHGVLQMGLMRSISTTMSREDPVHRSVLASTSTVSTIEALHVPIHTTGYSGKAHRTSEEMAALRCKCGHRWGEHMTSKPHACAEEPHHCRAFDPEPAERAEPKQPSPTNNRKDEAEW